MTQIRIVGGQWRSRRIAVASAAALRPTPDRVRETLFNWLGQDLSGQHCLDLFAGSGALGFEAASRGAQKVVLVEQNPKVVHYLRQTVRMLGAEQVEIVAANALQFVRNTPECPFDVVFLDPPFNTDLLTKIKPFLPDLIHDDGFVYVESAQRLAAMPGWEKIREGQAGQVFFHLLRKDMA